ncbi:TMEM175 family protein [soil metagenome]
MSDNDGRWIEGGSEVDRIVYFSDAVFAIAITLLALEIRLPDVASSTMPELLDALVGILPKLSSYAISFWVVATLWMAHHRIFHYIEAFDRRLLLINLLLLMWVALIPFSGSMLGEYGEFQVSVIVYCAHMVLASLNLAWLWWYACKDHRLVDPDMDPRVVRYYSARSFLMPVMFLIAILISFVNVNVAEFSLLLIFLVRPAALKYAQSRTAG